MSDIQIEGYQLRALRGEHRMGTVYDALQLSEAREVELLLLHPSLQQLPGLEQRFFSAAHEAINLGETLPGIVPVYASGSHGAAMDQRLFLARHAFAAKGLGAYLGRRQKSGTGLPVHALPQVILASASLLESLHQQGFIHGNLTPAALRLPAAGRMHLTDLGLPALRVPEVAAIKAQAIEILPFMSPEQMLGQELTVASDIFSLGVIAYYLTTGRLPRPISELSRGLKNYWAYTPQLLHDVLPAVEPHFSAVVHKALSITAEHRFADAAQIVDALQELVEPEAEVERSDVRTTTATSVASPAPPPSTAAGSEMSVSVRTDQLHIAPGEAGELQLTIVNQSPNAQNFTVKVDGVPRQWVVIPQEFVRLASGTAADVAVSIMVPRDSSAEFGDRKLQVEVTSTGRAPETKVVECTLAILPYQELAIEMQPQVIRQGQSVNLTLHNTGNETLRLAVSGEDESGSLRFSGERKDLVVRPGHIETLAVRVSAREQPLVGRARILPFFIKLASGEDLSERLKGEVSVTPVVPTWLAGIVLVALLATCGGLAFLIGPQLGNAPPATVQGTAGPTLAILAATATNGDVAVAEETVVITVTEAVTVTTTLTPFATSTDAGVGTATPGGDDQTAQPDVEPTVEAATQTPSALPSETPQASPTAEEEIAPANEIAVQLEVGESDQIWVVARDGSTQRLLIENGAEMAWSPDGRRLAFTQPSADGISGAERLFVITAAGTQLSPLNEPVLQIGALSWSPDGSQIAYHAIPAEPQQETGLQVFVANADGSGTRQLTTGADGFDNMWPLWSPQGSQILVYSQPQLAGRTGQLRLIAPSAGAPLTLFEDSDWNLFAAEYDWSPSGDRIVFSASQEDDPSQLYVISTDAQNPEAITTEGAGARLPDWSPAGDMIAYVAGTDDAQEAVTLIGAGGGDEQILAGGLPVNRVFWSSGGDEVGIVADFNFDGLFQLFVFAADGSGLVPLVEDATSLANAASDEASVVSAHWRPQEP